MRTTDIARTWMQDFHDKHGVWPIAGGAGEEEPPAPAEEPLVVPAPEPEPEAQQTAEPPSEDGQRFTAEDIQRARQQEKDKIYGRLDEVTTELQTLREEREAEKARLAEEEARLAEEIKAKEEAEMETRDLLQRKEQEWQSRFEEMQEELRKRDAIEEREREFQRLQSYKEQKISEHAEEIMPELRDMIDGSSPEEIDRAVSTAVEKTSSILEQVRQQQVAQRQAMPGTRPTAPPLGPIEENESQQQTLTSNDIQAMSMDEYMKHRYRLKQAVSDRVNQRGPYQGR